MMAFWRPVERGNGVVQLEVAGRRTVRHDRLTKYRMGLVM